MVAAGIPEKDVPLRYDIRLLGRILGETVHALAGEAASCGRATRPGLRDDTYRPIYEPFAGRRLRLR